MRGENVERERPMNETGKIEISYSNRELIAVVAKALRSSGKTCDDDSWDVVLASEAVHALRQMGAIK